MSDQSSNNEWEDVTPVRQPAKPVIIKVTWDHIRRGIRNNVYRDPMSLAIQEHFKADAVMTGWGYCSVFYQNLKVGYTLSPHKITMTFMKNFDLGRTVSPIEFEMWKDREVDTTPKTSRRKPSRQKNFTDLQIAAQKAQAKLDL